MLNDTLFDDKTWQDFFAKKIKNVSFDDELAKLNHYKNNNYYKQVVNAFVLNNYSFNIPTLKKINKYGTSKKRNIYIYNDDDILVQSFIAYYLHSYDHIFSKNCYAFKSCNLKNLYYDLFSDFSNTDYAYKTDVTDYFNSIDIDVLINMLKNSIDDELLLNILVSSLKNDKVIFNGELTTVNHGIFTGCALSGFFANLYLDGLDKIFDNLPLKYARYSDDIIIIGNKEDVTEGINIVHNYFDKLNLKINKGKEHLFAPNSKIDFLGFSYQNGTIDISSISKSKLFAKIRRKARLIRREYLASNLPLESAVKKFFSALNKKFYIVTSERNWTLWYFPVINTDNTLKLIDSYIIQYARYIFTGKFSKTNFNIKYDYLKTLGFKSLVNEYYKNKKANFR